MAAKKKTTKKALNKSSVKKVESPMVEEVKQEVFDSSKVKRVGNKTKIALILSFIVIVVALYKGRGLFIAAMVNNQPITRFAVISDLEKHSGKQSLDSLITQAIIDQEAKKQNVSVTPSEVDDAVKQVSDSVKAQGQDLNSLLSLQGMTMDDLREQLHTQKIIEKILGSQVEPTDKDVADYIKTNKMTPQAGQTQDQLNASVKDQLRQQNLSTKFQTWIADLRAKSNIKYYVNY